MTHIKFRYFKIDITPKRSYALPGYLNYERNGEEVHSRLSAQVILLRTPQKTIALASIDTFYIGAQFEEQLRDMLNRTLDLDLSLNEIFCSASHSHFAPSLDDRDYPVNLQNPEYFEQVIESMDAAFQQSGAWSDASLYKKSIDCHHLAINRRRKIRQGWFAKAKMSLGPDPRKKNPKKIHLIAIKETDGNHEVLLWNFPCHPTRLPNKDVFSSHFVGAVNEHIRQSCEHITPVFFQGFAGDLIGGFSEYHWTWPEHLRVLIGRWAKKEIVSSDFDLWTRRISSFIIGGLDGGWQILKPEFKVAVHQQSMTEFGYETDLPFILKSFQLSKDCRLLGINGEPVFEWDEIVRRHFPDVHFACGYLPSTFGYLPTGAMLKDGGYEVSGFMDLFAVSGKYHSRLDERVIHALNAVASA